MVRWTSLLRMRAFWCVAVLVCEALSRVNAGTWTGDFWSHAAAVREVALRPLAPQHPEVLAAVPGAFMTPYAVALGWLVALTRLDPVTVLASAGVVNLTLLLLAIRRYVREVADHTDTTFFYAVLFVLLAWGSDPWVWSGFFHLTSLHFVSPYPSTLAAAVFFVLLAVHIRWLRSAGRPVALLFAGLALLVLIHPVTAVACGVGMLANTLAVASARSWRARVLLLSGVTIFAAAVATSWPFYPFWDAVASTGFYDSENAEMYVSPWPRIWPSVTLALAAVLLFRTWRAPTAVFALLLTGLYLAGALTERYTLGRLVAHLALLLQLLAAVAAADVEWAVRQRRARGSHLAYAALTSAVLAIVLPINGPSLWHAVTDRSDWTSMYRVLQRHVGADEVVLANQVAGYPVPSFAGKVVAHVGVLLFVTDAEERRAAVDEFFGDDVTVQRRAEILQRWQVAWILLTTDERDSLAPHLDAVGDAVHSDAHFVLLRVRAPPAR